jgi:hypothetical protein
MEMIRLPIRFLEWTLLAALLAGCAGTLPWQDNRQEVLRQEAGRLSELVAQKKITKVQAADRLNIKRMEVVGKNYYDDEVFAYYHHLAEERDGNRLSLAESESLMRKKLADVRTRYRQDPKRKTPVFTNFVLSLYRMPTL